MNGTPHDRVGGPGGAPVPAGRADPATSAAQTAALATPTAARVSSAAARPGTEESNATTTDRHPASPPGAGPEAGDSTPNGGDRA